MGNLQSFRGSPEDQRRAAQTDAAPAAPRRPPGMTVYVTSYFGCGNKTITVPRVKEGTTLEDILKKVRLEGGPPKNRLKCEFNQQALTEEMTAGEMGLKEGDFIMCHAQYKSYEF
mmetsp:Transcript_6939/g.13644  ORF Transcript_6939/g.13644 Transcript_6939/m.13644 type:complete len:115 (+) Transcript_6939:138-482(+)